MASSDWLEVVNGIIVAPSEPTCNGNVFDFFVVHKGLEPSIAGVPRLEDAGLSPHWHARLLIRGDTRRNVCRQMIRPRYVPATLPMGPLLEQLASTPGHIGSYDELNCNAEAWHVSA